MHLLVRAACLLVLLLAVLAPGPFAEARTRKFCDVAGICEIPFVGSFPCERNCGRHNQPACDTGAACDSGYRLVTSSFMPGLPTSIDCPSPIANESLAGVCVSCGGHGEISCTGGTCDAGIVWNTTAALSGPITQCKPSLPPDPPNFSMISAVTLSGIQNTTVNPPPIETWLNTYNLCSNSSPDNLAAVESREPWPVEESPSGERGTVFILHGRGGSCTGNRNAIGQLVYERNHRVYCVEYAQGGYDPNNPNEPATIRTVRALPLLIDETGNGAAGCGSGECVFARNRPVLEVEAASLTNTAVAAALAEIVQKVPTVGRITLIGHSQGGYPLRALLHAWYDELRWRGRQIERVITLGHPYFAKEQDPQLYPAWACVKPSAGEGYDCAVGRWLQGYDNWLASSPYRLDESDFPQIDWAAMAGDGFAPSGECADDPLPPTCPPHQSLEPAYTTLEESEQCSLIFGNVPHSSVAGDTSVPIQSSLGIDEHDFYPVDELEFDYRSTTRCQHTGSCQLADALAQDPLRLLPVPPAPIEVGSVDLDGVDDVLRVVDSFEELEVTGALSLDLWIRPEREGQTEMILNKEGEYELQLANGVLAWAIANGSPGWVGQSTGYAPPVHRWTHIALVYDPNAGLATTYANGNPIDSRAASGAIGDTVAAQDEFWLGSRQADPSQHFDGRIDEVRVWDRALTRQEVMFALIGIVDINDPGLLAWWDFETLDFDTYASSAQGVDVDLVAPSLAELPVRRAPPKVLDDAFPGGALYFDGIDDRAVLSDPGELSNFANLSALTLEAWVYPRGPGGGLGGVIANKEGEFALVRSTSGQVIYSLDNTTPNWAASPTGVTLPTGTWSHVAFTYDDDAPQAEAIKLYLNGALAFTGSGDGPIQDNHPAEDELQVGGRQLNDVFPSTADQWFEGAIDELRIWNRALAQGEIQAKMSVPIADPLAETGLLGNWRFDELETGLAAVRSSEGSPNLTLGRNSAAEQPARILAAQLPGYPMSLLPDTDGDGLSDAEELELGTDPGLADSDGDGLGDGFEARHGLDPTTGGDASGDPDGDGLDNLAEQGAGTDPNLADSDGDGIDDAAELGATLTDPLVADPFTSGLDQDGDGLTDLFEVTWDTDPLSPDPPGLDRDGDGLSDAVEQSLGTDPTSTDSDGDGLDDAAEQSLGSDPLEPDGDGDGVSDLLETTLTLTDPAVAQPFGSSLFATDATLDAVLEVDVASGERKIVSGAGVGSGPALGSLLGLAEDPGGTLLLVERSASQILRVDPLSGARTVVSGGGTGSGPGLFTPSDLVVESDGSILVASEGDSVEILRVDPASGDRTLLGVIPSAGNPYLALEASGALLATDSWEQGVRRMDPATGALSTVSSGSVGSGPTLVSPAGLAIAPDGAILWLDSSLDAVVAIDPVSGDRAIVSDAATGLPAPGTGQCNGFCAPRGLASPQQDVVLVGDAGSTGLDPRDAVLWVDLVNGHRTIVTYRYRGTGPQLDDPKDLLWFRGLDQDGDALTDLEEIAQHGTHPRYADTDGDALADGDEANLYGTDPLLLDTDGDGWGDGDELQAGSDPLDPQSFPAAAQPVPALPPEAFGLMLGLIAALPAWLEWRRRQRAGRG